LPESFGGFPRQDLNNVEQTFLSVILEFNSCQTGMSGRQRKTADLLLHFQLSIFHFQLFCKFPPRRVAGGGAVPHLPNKVPAMCDAGMTDALPLAERAPPLVGLCARDLP
jgi:hypothetical protein